MAAGATTAGTTATTTTPTQAKAFLARVSVPTGEDPVETTKLGVALSTASTVPAHITPVPWHAETEVPSAADVYLQIWELDLFEVNYTSAQDPKFQKRCMPLWKGRLELDSSPPENRLLATIPGCVIKKGSGFEFRALGDPVPERSYDRAKGKVQFKLKDEEGADVEHTINLPEFEAVLELSAVLRANAGDTSFGEARAGDSGITFVHNVEASLRRQVAERGGIACSFAAQYAEPVSANDAEMARQGEEMVAVLPTFVVKDGKLRFGYHKAANGYTGIAAKLQEVITAAEALLEASGSPLAVPVKVSTLLLISHGIRQKMALNSAGYNAAGSLRVIYVGGTNAKTADPVKLTEFVTSVKEHLTDPLVIPLCACNTGRGERPGGGAGGGEGGGDKDASYGLALVGEQVGHDSLAYHLHKELVAQGFRNATVWAHTTSGHNTRNAFLRVFSRWGIADLVNVLVGARAVTAATRSQYLDSLAPVPLLDPPINSPPATWQLYYTKLRNANLLRPLCVQSAMYLPWSWLARMEDADEDFTALPGYTEAAREQAEAFLRMVDALIVDKQAAPEEWTYDETKQFILGKSDVAPADPRLSKNFVWSELSTKATPFKLRIEVMKALQIVRSRSTKSMTVRAIFDEGDGIAVAVGAPAANAQIVLQKAKELIEAPEERLTGAWLKDGVVYMSAGLVEYDEAFDYVVGVRDECAMLTRDLSWLNIRNSASPPPDKVNRALLWELQRLKDASRAEHLQVIGVEDAGDTLVVRHDPALEEAALAALTDGRLKCVGLSGEGELRSLSVSMRPRAPAAP